ncbi:MAG: MBL fold metallo-hydrolase [Firmicutes bacterium]|nr:MBL fold metallo-hydrolase [Bacillota bacterium]HXL04208.1 MBL fold metallo-hydrolase [Bacillota bacterium]
MIISTIRVGAFGTNCYIVGCETSKEAIVIDPGDDADRILEKLKAEGLICKIIANTHGHVDHIAANKALAEATGAIIAIGAEDAPALEDPTLNLSPAFSSFAKGKTSPPADLLLAEGDTLYAGGVCLRVLHTPGHTPGSISLLGEGVVFSGDVIFAQGGIGRTDLPGGSYDELMESIEEKLLVLPDETLIYPGHGPFTTIGWERAGFSR